jgi:hypothetical protein
MGSKPPTALAATVVAVALASFPAGAAAVKDYSQNSVNGEAAAPLPAELLKDYSMNAATGDYAPPIAAGCCRAFASPEDAPRNGSRRGPGTGRSQQ